MLHLSAKSVVLPFLRLLQIKAGNVAKPRLKEEEHSSFHQASLKLTNQQLEAIEKLKTISKPALLHGVTGSGKTEIYLQFILEILKENKQAILLVPEISLTPQLIGRVESRLNQKIAIYHSGLSESWRHLYWEKMRKGELKVAVGTS